MRGHAEPIDEALVMLGRAVTDELTAAGWAPRELGGHSITTLTRDTRNGVIAAVELGRTSLRWPDRWPVEIGVRLGVGYEPALDLMPLLILRPAVSLVRNPRTSGRSGFTISLRATQDVGSAGRQIVAFINENALPFAEQFPDAAAIETALRPGREAGGESGEQKNADRETSLRLTLLAATARHEEARALLARYPAEQGSERTARERRRFVRQLTRWLDAGGPPVPPIAQTLALLPPAPRSHRPSWSAARERTHSSQDALDAARAQSAGKPLVQLIDLVAAEHDRRGVEIAPSTVALHAEMLRVEQRPFGRARSALRAIRMLKSGGGDVITLIKNSSDDDPRWLRPPERAGYPVHTTTDRYAAIELDRGAHDWLARVWSEAPRRLGYLSSSTSGSAGTTRPAKHLPTWSPISASIGSGRCPRRRPHRSSRSCTPPRCSTRTRSSPAD